MAGLQCNKFRGDKDKIILPKRPRNAAWYKEKAMLVEAQEAGQILDEEQLAFLADLGIPASQAQTVVPHNAAFQTEDLNTYDFDYNDLSNAQAVLMANISNYGYDVILEVPNSETYLNDMDNQSVLALWDFEQSPVMDFIDIEISKYFVINDLKARLQDKDTTICKLKDTIKSLEKNTKEKNVHHEKCDLEPINEKMENSVATLISENEQLWNEINHVKQVFKDQFDSIKQTRIEIVENASQIPSAITIAPSMFKLDLVPLPPRLLQNREAHIDYIKHTQENANILREIVELTKAKQPLDSELEFACKYATRIQELLVYVQDMCPKAITHSSKKIDVTPMNNVKKVRFVEPITSSIKTQQVEYSKTSDSNTHVLSSTGVKYFTSNYGSKPTGNKKNDRISQKPSKNMKNNVEAQPRKVNKLNRVTKPVCDVDVKHSLSNVNSKILYASCNKSMFDAVVQIVLWNDQIARIMGYGDYQLRNVVISRVYYIEGLGHNLFSVGQFCDADLEVSFWKNTCFIRNLEGVDLLSGSRDTNLLSHLNFGTLNKLAKDGLARGIPRLKFQKDHLCSACALGKSKNLYATQCLEYINQEKLYLFHMDLCGLMRVASINGKRLSRLYSGTVRFGNDQIARIMGYGDYQLGNVVISRVYYVEGLGHNLFSVGQFCDADLEVAFRKNTCFIRNLEGVDLLSGSRDTNLYTISLDDMLRSSPICLLSKASKTKSWLWHRRLSHLNFGTLNKLAKDGLARGIPRLKFQKDHLCSACALGKSKKSSHQPKAEDTNQEKLYLLHMDLCGPMRVASINEKKYILVIVDDYSRFNWVKFLKTKDEAPAAIIKCIKNIQVRLKAIVQNVRTDNGTKFVNQTLREWYKNVGITHQTSVARTPQQNGVVERRNRTLVEAARTMLTFSRAPLFL
ncbi:retrovirus-related pol polyprotein from transposon TNT 1-94 [Tanacetum coccineum]